MACDKARLGFLFLFFLNFYSVFYLLNFCSIQKNKQKDFQKVPFKNSDLLKDVFNCIILLSNVDMREKQ